MQKTKYCLSYSKCKRRNYVQKTKNVVPTSDKSFIEIDDKVSSKDEDDFDDELSWYESEPEMDALSDLNSKTDGSDTESENEDCSVCQEV